MQNIRFIVGLLVASAIFLIVQKNKSSLYNDARTTEASKYLHASTARTKVVESTITYVYPEGVKWRTLKSILDNKLVASTYIWIIALPIIMTATSKFPNSIDIYPWGMKEPLILVFDFPINWYSLYFSAILFAIARLLYIARCPNFLKSHSSASDTLVKGVSIEIVWDNICSHRYKLSNKKITGENAEREALFRMLYALDGQEATPNTETKRKNSELYRLSHASYVIEKPGTGLFHIFTNGENRYQVCSRDLLVGRFLELLDLYSPKVRTLTAIITSIGIILLLFPVCQGFKSVLERLLF